MKTRLLLLLLFFLNVELFASSQIDSLMSKLMGQTGKDRANTLFELARVILDSDTAKSFSYIRESISIYNEIEDLSSLALAYKEYGELLYAKDEFPKAIPQYEQAIDLYSQLDSINAVGELYNSIGLSYYYLDEIEKAIVSQIEAVKNFEKTSNLMDLTRIYLNMGMFYERLKDFASAIQYYGKAVQIARQTGDILRLGNGFNGLGVAHYNAGRLDSAKINYRKALKFFKQAHNEQRAAAAINNLGNIYIDEGDSLQIGLNYYNEAYDIFEKQGNLRNKVYVMEGLGCAYRELGDYEKALEYFSEGLNISIENQYGYYIIQLYYEDIADVYEKAGDIGNAYAAFKNHKLYLDSMRMEERLFQAAAIEKKYEFTKKEALISQLNTDKEMALIQLEKNKAFRNLGVFAIFILIVIISYVSFGSYNRKRMNRELVEKNIQIEHQKSELEKLNTSKNKFFSIIAHDLKNPLHTVLGYSFLLNHEYDRFDDKDRRKYARDIYNSTNNIFRLLQNLLDWSKSQTGRLHYEPVIFELSSLQEKICNLLIPVAQQKNISLVCEVPQNIYVYATPMMIETVLRNLLSNAIKFTPVGGRVTVDFKKDKRDMRVFVIDNGVGMSDEELGQLFSIDSKTKRKGTDNEDGTGLGLILCKEFVTLNKGKIWVESEVGKGSTFCFTVPLALEEG